MGDTRFKPGKSGNPGGRPALPIELRIARKENQVEVVQLVSKLMWMESSEYEKRRITARRTQIEEALIGVIDRAATGDVNALKSMLDLLCGKIPEDDGFELTSEEIMLVEEYRRRIAEKSAPKQGQS